MCTSAFRWSWVLLVVLGVRHAAAEDALTAAAGDDPDPDLAFQGEYSGWQQANRSPRSSERVGMQVVARGDGSFDAVKYMGGLPGARRFHKERYTLTGRRSGDFVELIGEKFDVVLEADAATVIDKEGRVAGELARIERVSPTMGLAPPAKAVVLFGEGVPGLLASPQLSEAGWLLAGTETVDAYQHYRLHAEFRLPFTPLANGQARGNSGFYVQSRYEIQILDSFGLEGLNNECGALYKQRAPDLNMCLPPLQWQTYDIDFRAPRMTPEGKKLANGRISVWHNGVLIHDDAEIVNKTGSGQPEGPDPLPTKIQYHGNPVVFRNLWLVETTGSEEDDWPALPSHVPPTPVAFIDRPAVLN